MTVRTAVVLALSFILLSCASAPKAEPVAPMPVLPAPKEQPCPPGPGVLFSHRVTVPAQGWAEEKPSERERCKVFLKLRNTDTGAWYRLQAATAEPKEDAAALAAYLVSKVSDLGAETSDIIVSADGRSASFYYEIYGTETRGKMFILLKPDCPFVLVAEASWPVERQGDVLPAIDAMNASLDISAMAK